MEDDDVALLKTVNEVIAIRKECHMHLTLRVMRCDIFRLSNYENGLQHFKDIIENKKNSNSD